MLEIELLRKALTSILKHSFPACLICTVQIVLCIFALLYPVCFNHFFFFFLKEELDNSTVTNTVENNKITELSLGDVTNSLFTYS